MRVRRKCVSPVVAAVPPGFDLAGGVPAQYHELHTGTVVGFRLPLMDMQLPWAAVVVRWDAVDEARLDLTGDMPQLAVQQCNPWDITPLQS